MSEKNDKTRSQAQQTFEPFRAFGQEQLERMNAMFDEWKKLEAQGIDRACTAIDEMAQLARTSFGYATRLTDEWRKLVLEGSRHAMELTNVRM